MRCRPFQALVMNNSDHYFNYIYYPRIRLYSPIVVENKSSVVAVLYWSREIKCAGTGWDRNEPQNSASIFIFFIILLFYYEIVHKVHNKNKRKK